MLLNVHLEVGRLIPMRLEFQVPLDYVQISRCVCLLDGSATLVFSGAQSHAHIDVCLLDTNRRTTFARILFDGSTTLDAAPAAIGHGAAIRPAEPRVFLTFVMLALHPCQQAASHLACTWPPDFVACRCSFTVFTPATSSSSTEITRILLDGSATLDAAQPIQDLGPHAFGGPHPLQGFLLLPSEGYNISKACTSSMADLPLISV